MNSALALFLSSVLVSAAIFDIRVQKIPNLLTYPTMAVGLIYHSFTNGVEGFFFGAGGIGVGIGLFLIPYLIGVMGAGDAKLMGAVGAALGAKGVFYAVLLSAIVGGQSKQDAQQIDRSIVPSHLFQRLIKAIRGDNQDPILYRTTRFDPGGRR